LAKNRFEWDEDKDPEDQFKHKVSFSMAQRAFLDPGWVIPEDLTRSEKEAQFYCMGQVEGGILTIRFIFRANVIHRIPERREHLLFQRFKGDLSWNIGQPLAGLTATISEVIITEGSRRYPIMPGEIGNNRLLLPVLQSWDLFRQGTRQNRNFCPEMDCHLLSSGYASNVVIYHMANYSICNCGKTKPPSER